MAEFRGPLIRVERIEHLTPIKAHGETYIPSSQAAAAHQLAHALRELVTP